MRPKGINVLLSRSLIAPNDTLASNILKKTNNAD